MQRVLFPLVNGLIGALLGFAVGYYAGNAVLWAGGAGLLLALLAAGIDAAFGRRGGWLYRRRVLLLALLQIVVFIFVIGPYAYVLSVTAPNRFEINGEPLPGRAGYTFEEVRFEGDGVTLAGWYIPPTGEHGGVVLVLHGSGGNRTAGTWYAEQLYDAGYGVLMYDQRALGESEGEMQSWGWHDIRDLPGAVDFVVSQPGVNPERIGGIGLSLGAAILLNGMGVEPRIRALWLDGVGANGWDDAPPPESAGRWFQYAMTEAVELAMQVRSGERPPPLVRTLVATTARPIMMIAAELDTMEAATQRGYHDVANDNVTFWEIPNAVHVGGRLVVPDEYRTRMIDFFDTHLGVTR